MEMIRVASVFIYLFVLTCTFTQQVVDGAGANVALSEFSNTERDQIRFVGNLLKSIRFSKNTDNPIFSPPTVLSVLIAGHCATSRGTTRNEIFEVLEAYGNCGQTSELAKELSETTNAKITNTMYVTEGARTNHGTYKRYTDKFMNERCLYSDEKTVSAKLINDRISRDTSSRLENVLSAKDIDKDTAALMISTIDFDGEWQKPFRRVVRDAIKNEKNQISHVCMMSQDNEFLYGNIPQLKASVVEIPFKYKNYSMLIFLPHPKVGSLKYLEEQLYKLDITQIDSKLKSKKLSLYMPQFQVKYKKSLRDPLQKMDITMAFTKKADFGDFIEYDKMTYIRDIRHQAFIEVNPKGFKGSAVTDAKWNFVKKNIINYSVDQKDVQQDYEDDIIVLKSKNQPFEVDRPFIYAVIRKNVPLNRIEDRTNYLFVGSVTNIGTDKISSNKCN